MARIETRLILKGILCSLMKIFSLLFFFVGPLLNVLDSTQLEINDTCITYIHQFCYLQEQISPFIFMRHLTSIR